MLQVVSPAMNKGVDIVQRRKVRDILEVTCPNDFIMYQKQKGGVEHGDQHRLMEVFFSNMSHFRQWDNGIV